jgi:hypothetical protein
MKIKFRRKVPADFDSIHDHVVRHNPAAVKIICRATEKICLRDKGPFEARCARTSG